MKLIISISTNAKGDTGVFMVAQGEPATVLEKGYADCIEKMVGDFLREASRGMAAKKLARTHNCSGDAEVRTLEKQFQGGELPPKNPSGN